MKKSIVFLSSLIALTLIGLGTSFAAEPRVIELKIENHLFTPDLIEVSVGEKFILHVKNMDAQAEEFESKPLHQEKIIAGHGEAMIKVNGLKEGKYLFVGEFHEDECKGYIVVK